MPLDTAQAIPQEVTARTLSTREANRLRTLEVYDSALLDMASAIADLMACCDGGCADNTMPDAAITIRVLIDLAGGTP